MESPSGRGAAGFPPLSLSIPADLAEVGRAGERVRSHLEGCGFPEELVFAADLVVEELASNVAKYAYGTAGGDLLIEVEPGPGSVRLRVTDRGHPFDPTSHPPISRPDPDAPARAGGRGIHLVRELCRAFLWRRDADRNVVEVELAVPAGASR